MRRLLFIILLGLTLSGCSNSHQARHDAVSTAQDLKAPDTALQQYKPEAYIEQQNHYVPTLPNAESKTSISKERNKPLPKATTEAKVAKQSEKQVALNQTAQQKTRSTKQRARHQIQMKQRASKRLTIAQLHNKYPQLFKLRGSSKTGNKVALTFDDVPDQTITPVILDILKQENIKATFFLVGYRAERNPSIVKRMVDEGHIIGNHTYNHPLLTRQDLPKFIRQLRQTENIIDEITGYKPRYFRPPFGEITEEQLQWAGKHGYMVVNWDVDSNDWRGIPAVVMENNIINDVVPGSIVLQHAGGAGKKGYLDNTVKALPSIIKRLKTRQYEFVTIPELLNGSKDKD
ncbi:polysaccharide deacetylase family protein [Paenibacillus sp. SC116]|uniref:polysaccharide deacetylase family protein n=1 Tax=Paenibacillus sp. SC116 TaxID=2968986 RepID=UPI00215A7891|nr:polysaccharide deacetylase family protein [Paenibacillus sp. SC116]MCR8842753.1 polysaccharide deacetylase family protein [Paenibacillus sp. SC116]